MVDWRNTTENNIQYRANFYITKRTRKVTWDDIYELVNSIKAVPYKFEWNINWLLYFVVL